MSRRASKGTNPTQLIIIAVLLVAIFVVGVSLLTKKKSPFNSDPVLPMSDIMQNANSLRGNTYRVEGKIEERWVKSSSEGVHLSVNESGQLYPVFIKIPQGLERPNLEREKQYSFSVEIGEGGIPIAKGIQRL